MSNLTLACVDCNQKKGNQTASEFGFPELMDVAKTPLIDAGVVNSIRWALYRHLVVTGLPIETGTGGRTKYNRTRLGWPKTHWRDAACVGASTPENLQAMVGNVLLITSTGHGTRQMCRMDKYGFPIRHVPRQKRHFGFKTGDLVQAVVPKGKYAGRHVGRVAIRKSGSFNIATAHGLVQGISHRYLRIVQRADGYAYSHRKEERASSVA